MVRWRRAGFENSNIRGLSEISHYSLSQEISPKLLAISKLQIIISLAFHLLYEARSFQRPGPEGWGVFKTSLKLVPVIILNMNLKEILADPGISYWLKDAIKTAYERDPIDAMHDARRLLKILGEWYTQMVNRDRTAL